MRRFRQGVIDLREFYARRIRRLLPISTVVLVVSTLSALLILPSTSFSSLGLDVVAAAGFVVNMLFAARGTDYLAGDADPSIFQHYWSACGGGRELPHMAWPSRRHFSQCEKDSSPHRLRALRSSSLLHFSQACYSPRQCRPGRISVSTREPSNLASALCSL